MTPYTYELPDGTQFVQHFPMGEAPREMGDAKRVYDAALQFTYGKENFHGPTVGERLEADKKEWANAGITAAPADSNGKRWI